MNVKSNGKIDHSSDETCFSVWVGDGIFLAGSFIGFILIVLIFLNFKQREVLRE